MCPYCEDVPVFTEQDLTIYKLLFTIPRVRPVILDLPDATLPVIDH